MTPKIFTWCIPGGFGVINDVCAFAMAEDGTALGSHVSSNASWAKADISRPPHSQNFDTHYPDGYEVVWLGELHNGSDVPQAFKDALAINHCQEGDRAEA